MEQAEIEGSNLASKTSLFWLGKILWVGVFWTERERGQKGSRVKRGVNLESLAWRDCNL